MSELVRAAGLLIYRIRNNVNEYLMLQASYEPFHWTPPKGHVEPKEDEWAAALRETYEEAGIEFDQLEIFKDFQHVMHYKAHNKEKRVTYWLANLRSIDGKLPDADIRLSHEHQSSAWVHADEAIRLGKYEETAKMIREAEAYLATKKSTTHQQ